MAKINEQMYNRLFESIFESRFNIECDKLGLDKDNLTEQQINEILQKVRNWSRGYGFKSTPDVADRLQRRYDPNAKANMQRAKSAAIAHLGGFGGGSGNGQDDEEEGGGGGGGGGLAPLMAGGRRRGGGGGGSRGGTVAQPRPSSWRDVADQSFKRNRTLAQRIVGRIVHPLMQRQTAGQVLRHMGRGMGGGGAAPAQPQPSTNPVAKAPVPQAGKPVPQAGTPTPQAVKPMQTPTLSGKAKRAARANLRSQSSDPMSIALQAKASRPARAKELARQREIGRTAAIAAAHGVLNKTSQGVTDIGGGIKIPSNLNIGGATFGMSNYSRPGQIDFPKAAPQAVNPVARKPRRTKAGPVRASRDLTQLGNNLSKLMERTKKGNTKNNPWAICHASTGPETGDKFESCVKKIKSRLGKK